MGGAFLACRCWTFLFFFVIQRCVVSQRTVRRHIGGTFKHVDVWLLRVFFFYFSFFSHLFNRVFWRLDQELLRCCSFFFSSSSALISVRCAVAFVVAVVPLCPQQRALASRRAGEAFFLSHLVNKARLGRRSTLRRRGEPTEAPAMVKTNHASFFIFFSVCVSVCMSVCVSGSQPALLIC